MKQKDIALIVVIAAVSGVISFFVSGKIFVTSSNREQKVEKVDAISADFKQPDSKYFNKDSINPAQTIQLGESNNQTPFKGSN